MQDSSIKKDNFMLKQENERINIIEKEEKSPKKTQKHKTGEFSFSNQNAIINEENNNEILKTIKTLDNRSSFFQDFQQQRIKGWYFVPSFFCGFSFTILISTFLIIAGAVHLAKVSDLKEFKVSYGDLCKFKTNCILKIDLEEKIEGPVFFYYGLKYYYQNHRKYAKSISYKQIRGENDIGSKISASDLEKLCEGALMNYEMSDKIMFSAAGFLLNKEEIACPCGLIAKSFFNDSFLLFNEKNQSIFLNETDISYPNYRNEIFIRFSDGIREEFIDSNNEHFINWAKFSTTSYWDKLWARIPESLEKGTYYIQIENNYNISDFNGEKFITLANSSTLGGKNQIMGAIMLIAGIIYLLFAIYIVKIKKKLSETPNIEELDYDWHKYR